MVTDQKFEIGMVFGFTVEMKNRISVSRVMELTAEIVIVLPTQLMDASGMASKRIHSIELQVPTSPKENPRGVEISIKSDGSRALGRRRAINTRVTGLFPRRMLSVFSTINFAIGWLKLKPGINFDSKTEVESKLETLQPAPSKSVAI